MTCDIALSRRLRFIFVLWCVRIYFFLFSYPTKPVHFFAQIHAIEPYATNRIERECPHRVRVHILHHPYINAKFRCFWISWVSLGDNIPFFQKFTAFVLINSYSIKYGAMAKIALVKCLASHFFFIEYSFSGTKMNTPCIVFLVLMIKCDLLFWHGNSDFIIFFSSLKKKTVFALEQIVFVVFALIAAITAMPQHGGYGKHSESFCLLLRLSVILSV